MTSTQINRFRPDSRILKDLAWRAGLVLVATAAVVIGLPAWARAPLFVAAVLVTVLFVLRRFRRRGVVHGALTALAVVIVLLMALGLLLSLLPSGISTIRWGVGAGVIELVSLIGLAYWRAPNAATRPWKPVVSVAAVVWTILVAGVLATALVWSIASVNAHQVAPLAVAAVSSGESATVTVSSGRDEGPYELQVVNGTSRTVLAHDIRIGPGKSASFTIKIPSGTREKVQLVRAGTEKSLRELILDSTIDTSKVTP